MFVVVDLFLASYGFYKRDCWKQFIAESTFSKKISQSRGIERYLVTIKTENEFVRDLFGINIPSSYYATLFGLYSPEDLK